MSFVPPFVSMGLETKKISLTDVFGENRQRLVRALRTGIATATTTAAAPESVTTATTAKSTTTTVTAGVVYLTGGPSPTRYDSDHEPIFRQESYMQYLTGCNVPDCAVAILVSTGSCTLFVPKLPAEYATFMGRIECAQEWKNKYQVDRVQYTDRVEDVLLDMLSEEKQQQEKSVDGVVGTTTTTTTVISNGGGGETTMRNGHPPSSAAAGEYDGSPKILLMKGRNSDSGRWYEPPANIVNSDSLRDRVDVTTLFPVLAECRVTKSAAELDILRYVSRVSSFAHVHVMRGLRPGQMEYQAESAFRHYCYAGGGCRLTGYTPICGCGPNSAVLHYGHAAEPNARRVLDVDMCLFDMGAEYFGYGSDITCSFPASGTFTDTQRAVYEAVLNAQRAVLGMMKPGVSWSSCHEAAEGAILRGLIDLGAVVPRDKTVQELVDMRLGAVFMPHGLGHLIGLDTHDVGGYLPGHPPRSALAGLKSLRTARVLLPGMTITVEPGCYFIDHLLDSALQQQDDDDTTTGSSSLRKYLNEDMLNSPTFRTFGGVRLEDVVLVTESGVDNFTVCPRTVQEVEGVMAGAKWPPVHDDAPELHRTGLTDTVPLPAPPTW